LVVNFHQFGHLGVGAGAKGLFHELLLAGILLQNIPDLLFFLHEVLEADFITVFREFKAFYVRKQDFLC